jgi:transcriptional regulator with XRE-family HTH domain
MSVAQYKRPYREFGLRLKAARVRADLTQEELSIKIDGLSVYAVRLYEQGRCLPSAEKLHDLVTLLGITTADLFEGVSA